MFASTAMAQTGGSAGAAAPGGGPTDYIIQFAPLILLFVLFYFLMIRPQQRRAKLHAATIAGVKRGDTVVMSSGLIGKVTRVEDAEVAGTIDGTLTVRGNLIVRSTGRVLGTARCRRLQVEDGGHITGRIEMLTEGAAAKAPDVAA